MKKTTKLSREHFRYLTKKEFKNPLYEVADFCRSFTNLRDWKSATDKMIKVGCADTKRLKARDFSSLHFDWTKLVQHIDLLYLLKHQIKDWQIKQDSEVYDITFYPRQTIIYDPTLRDGTYMVFDRLKPKEIKNFGLFLDKFFNFMSCWEWQRTMDEWLSTFFDDNNLGMYTPYSDKASKIYDYIEKLSEAIYLVYVLKAKEHIFKHHVKDFYLEKYLDEKSDQTTEEGSKAEEETDFPPESPVSTENEASGTGNDA